MSFLLVAGVISGIPTVCVVVAGFIFERWGW